MSTNAPGARGLIFLSYAKQDSDFVDQVVEAIPRSHVFHDLSSMDPGESNLEQMRNGVMNANVYAMFVSPHAKRSVWVQYEAAIAEVQRIKRTAIRVIAIPIKGTTYRDAPDWMQSYFATDENFSSRDVARLLKHLFEQVLRVYPVSTSWPVLGN